MLKRFIIYGLLGWNMEVLWTGITSLSAENVNLIGHTSVWMFFIYGSAVFIFEPVYRIIADCNMFVRGCAWTALIFVIEFISGLLLHSIGIEAWYYNCRFAVCGVIRLDYAPAWFAVGLVFEKVNHILQRYKIGVK
ncbi:MAG: hypothetical protein ACI4RS_05360 [Monoglobaceae bacterium]